METLSGTVERVTYRSEETLYSVLRFALASTRQVVTVTGTFTAVDVGEHLEIQGEWMSHPAYGEQFRAAQYQSLPPQSAAGVEKYLGSGLIKGVGPATARKIVTQFGAEALDIIETSPERLSEVEGIGRKTAVRISASVAERRDIERVMVFLQGHGITTGLAARIYKHYGGGAVDAVSRNPYRLCDEVWGIGFVTADKIATAMGLPPDAVERLQAGLRYVLSHMGSEGHAMAPRAALLAEAARVLKCEEAPLEPALRSMLDTRELVEELTLPGVEGAPIYLPALYSCERGIARRVADLMKVGVSRSLVDFSAQEDLADIASSGSESSLSTAQQRAVLQILRSPVTILTGGPGTGKTTTLKAVIALLEKRGVVVVLAAPTGRAAKRMSEATGKPARTLHRLLEFTPQEASAGGFARNESNPIEADAIVIDEASMLDEPLAYHLLKAVRVGTRLVLVGDIDQLPSVGPGNVLQDLIGSGCLPVVRLTEVFRQAAGSLIVTNAHRINHGEMPVTNQRDGDFFLVPEETPADIAAAVVDLVARRLPLRYGLDPRVSIQVLTPMRLHEAGVESLNRMLQQTLNPAGPSRSEIAMRATIFRHGDRVMQVVNNYEKEAFNGDVGLIAAVDAANRTLDVAYPDAAGDRLVHYDQGDLDELVLAYAMSVHKSQGSEYPAVVIPMTTQHFRMLKRNLIYTAVTRAKQLAVLVGTKKALWIAVSTDDAESRFTLLAQRVRQEFGRGAPD